MARVTEKELRQLHRASNDDSAEERVCKTVSTQTNNANFSTGRSDSSCRFRNSTITRRSSSVLAGNPNLDPSNTLHELCRTKVSSFHGRDTATESGTKSTSQFHVTKSASSLSKAAKEAFKSLVPALKFRWIRYWPLNLQITNTWTSLKGE